MKEFGLRAVLTFFVLFTVTSFAFGAEAEDCRAIITKNYLNETAHFRLVPDDYGEPNFANDHVARSIYYIRELLNDLGCSRKAINFSKGLTDEVSLAARLFFQENHTHVVVIFTLILVFSLLRLI